MDDVSTRHVGRAVRLSLVILFLVLFTNFASANTINFTVDNMGADLCLSVGEFDNQVCHLNETLTVSGTSDHDYYITGEQRITNSSFLNPNTFIASILFPLTLFGGAGLVFVLFFGSIGLVFVLVHTL